MIRISPIYSHGPPLDPDGARAAARESEYLARLWHDHGAVMVRVDDLPEADWPIRDMLTRWAENQFGKRADKGA